MVKRIIIFLLAAVVFVAICIGGATIAYTSSDDYKSDILPEGTTVNGVDCSGLTYEKAERAISNKWNGETILVVDQTGRILDKYSDFGCSYSMHDHIATIKKNNIIKAALNHFVHMPMDVTIAMHVDKVGSDFKKQVYESAYLNSDNMIETQNAYVDIEDPDFKIVPEVYGNKPNKEKYLEDIIGCIEMSQHKFVFNEKDYPDIPTIKSDNPELLEYQAYLKEHVKQSITYKFGGEKVVIPATDILEFFDDDCSVNEAAVSKYVEGLAKKYDNVGIERKFKSPRGDVIKVEGGDYGWQIDVSGETRQLVSDLNEGKDVERKPVFFCEGYGKYSDGMGDTFVDVNVTKQRVTIYQDGKKVLGIDCVTGCKANGTITPTGCYQIRSKLRSVTLRGKNADGSDYESYVNYWVAFIGSSIGLHDASWRASFGGDIWIYGGSHGCVNISPSDMPDVFAKTFEGMPVVVHY